MDMLNFLFQCIVNKEDKANICPKMVYDFVAMSVCEWHTATTNIPILDGLIAPQPDRRFPPYRDQIKATNLLLFSML
jgi:hypothetical protein